MNKDDLNNLNKYVQGLASGRIAQPKKSMDLITYYVIEYDDREYIAPAGLSEAEAYEMAEATYPYNKIIGHHIEWAKNPTKD